MLLYVNIWKKKIFNLVNSLNEVITVLNNTIHTTTKKPIDVFIPLMNNLFNLVKNNTINSGKNYDSYFQYYKINDLIIIYNNFEYKEIKKRII